MRIPIRVLIGCFMGTAITLWAIHIDLVNSTAASDIDAYVYYLTGILIVAVLVKYFSDLYFAMKNTEDINRAIALMEGRGFSVYRFLPGVGIDETARDLEFEKAIFLLNQKGFIVTDSSGALAGAVLTAKASKMTSEDRAQINRAQFKIVKNDPKEPEE